MKDVNQLVSYICDKTKADKIEIWTRNEGNCNLQLHYSSHEVLFPLSNCPDSISLDLPYVVERSGECTYIAFNYSTELQAVLILYSPPHVSLNEETLEYLHLHFAYYFKNLQLAMREVELRNLVASIHSATSSLELEVLLSKITSHALAVLPIAECGLLQLYDHERGYLFAKGSTGFTASIQSFRPKLGEGITGKVFADGQARIFHSKQEMYEEMSNMTEENYLHLHEAVDSRSIKALISVPISIHNNRIGVMTLYQLHKNGQLTQRHLNLLQAFADQAAVSIHNATLYKQVSQRLQEVIHLSKQLTESNDFLQQRNEIHDTLTSIYIQSRGLKPLLQAMRRMLGRSINFVNLIDMDDVQATNSEKIFSIEEISMIFIRRNKPVTVIANDVEHGQASYYLYPILGSSVILGCLIVPYNEPLSRLAHITLEQGDSVLALELVKRMSLTEVYYKKTHEYFNELLQNKDPELLHAKGRELGINLSAILTVVQFELTTQRGPEALGVAIHRITNRIKQAITGSPHLIYGNHNKIIVLLTHSNTTVPFQYKRLFQAIAEEFQGNNDIRLAAGIGSSGEGIAHISRSNDEAGKALNYIANHHSSSVMHFETIGINRLFLNQEPKEIDRYLQEILTPLATDRSGSELEKTLFAYVKSNRSANQTAECLHIHINTLYNRIKRIEELLKLDFSRFEDYLKVQLACHLRETFSPAYRSRDE